MGPTWVLSSPVGPHAGPMNLVIWGLETKLASSCVKKFTTSFVCYRFTETNRLSNNYQTATGNVIQRFLSWSERVFVITWWWKSMASVSLFFHSLCRTQQALDLGVHWAGNAFGGSGTFVEVLTSFVLPFLHLSFQLGPGGYWKDYLVWLSCQHCFRKWPFVWRRQAND